MPHLLAITPKIEGIFSKADQAGLSSLTVVTPCVKFIRCPARLSTWSIVFCLLYIYVASASSSGKDVNMFGDNTEVIRSPLA